MKQKCLIIDDEPLAINVIKKYLTQFEGFELVGTCQNAIEAFNILSQKEIDLVFLDINMPQLNGIDFLKSLEKPPTVIVTTAYREYAVESYELDVIDYLVKPIAFPRFMKALHKVSRLLLDKTGMEEETEQGIKSEEKESARDTFTFFKVDKKMIKVYFKDILYIESLKDYVRIKTIYEDLITHYNLTGISSVLPEDDFMRIHRSYTIALDKVKAIEGNCVEIAGKLLPIGRNFTKAVKDRILNRSGVGENEINHPQSDT